MRGRFRRYDSEDIARLAFIRRARQLGFTLHEVRGLLRLAAAGGTEDARPSSKRSFVGLPLLTMRPVASSRPVVAGAGAERRPVARRRRRGWWRCEPVAQAGNEVVRTVLGPVPEPANGSEGRIGRAQIPIIEIEHD